MSSSHSCWVFFPLIFGGCARTVFFFFCFVFAEEMFSWLKVCLGNEALFLFQTFAPFPLGNALVSCQHLPAEPHSLSKFVSGFTFPPNSFRKSPNYGQTWHFGSTRFHLQGFHKFACENLLP